MTDSHELDARLTFMAASDDALEISRALDQLTDQLSRHALITALAALPGGTGATLARELAVANVVGDDEKFKQTLTRIPGAPGYNTQPLAVAVE